MKLHKLLLKQLSQDARLKNNQEKEPQRPHEKGQLPELVRAPEAEKEEAGLRCDGKGRRKVRFPGGSAAGG